MTSEMLLIILAAALSLLFSYIPGLATWYNPLDDTKKRLIMLGLLAVLTGAIFGLSCADIISSVTCDKPGAIGLLSSFLLALMANQGTNSISPKIGLKAPAAKHVEITTPSGDTTTVGVKELGTTVPEGGVLSGDDDTEGQYG